MSRDPLNQSTFELPAKEVLRLADLCILEVSATRRRQLQTAYKALNEYENSFFGFFKRKAYPTEASMQQTEEVQFAKNMLNGTLRMATILSAAAKMLINNPDIPEDKKVIRLTTADYFQLI